ncbi:MAG: tRNA 5-methoxyuridine(34)/uridine 5-oxyacetic acid(34) synthase CmoB, partial [Granulosicoccus sp.]
RSDWKWERLVPHIQPLDGRLVLDVGCGNGYHLWCMHAAGAACVLGIEPSLHYLMQFHAAQRYIQAESVQCVPLSMENLPQHMHVFDTAFSMGVLYHRRDPHSHLCELRQALKDAGELVLETLVVDRQDDSSLIIKDRYANMRNVYELPSPARLQRWLRDAGFASSSVVSVAPTDIQEQRRTAWMTSYSLAEALDARCPDRTIEGYPRPVRAVLVCRPAK